MNLATAKVYLCWKFKACNEMHFHCIWILVEKLFLELLLVGCLHFLSTTFLNYKLFDRTMDEIWCNWTLLFTTALRKTAFYNLQNSSSIFQERNSILLPTGQIRPVEILLNYIWKIYQGILFFSRFFLPAARSRKTSGGSLKQINYQLLLWIRMWTIIFVRVPYCNTCRPHL